MLPCDYIEVNCAVCQVLALAFPLVRRLHFKLSLNHQDFPGVRQQNPVLFLLQLPGRRRRHNHWHLPIRSPRDDLVANILPGREQLECTICLHLLRIALWLRFSCKARIGTMRWGVGDV